MVLRCRSAVLLFALATALCGCRRETPAAAYGRIWALFTSGDARGAAQAALIEAQHVNKNGPAAWDCRFRLLQAEALLAQGLVTQADALLASPIPAALESNQLELRRRMDRADACSKSGRLAEALASLQELRAAVADPELQTRIDVLYGGLLARARKLDQAEKVLNRAEREAAARGDSYQQASALLNLSIARKWAYRYSESVEYGLRSVALSDKYGYRRLSAIQHANLGGLYRILGDFDRAIQTQEKAIEALSAMGDRNNLLIQLGELGLSYDAQGRRREAIREYEQAYELALAMGRNGDAARNAVNLSLAYIELGGNAGSSDIAQADEWNQRARRLAGPDKESGAYQAFNAALIAWARGRAEEADGLYRQVLHDPTAPAPLLWDAHYNHGRAYAARKMYAEAAREFAAAVDLIDKTRSDLLTPSQQITFLAQLIDIHRAYVDLEVRRGHDMEAIRLSEASRSRVLAERIGGDAADAHDIDAARLTRLAKDANVTLLSFWLAPARSFAWLITPAGIQRFDLPPVDQIEPLVTAYRSVVENPLRDPIATRDRNGPALWDVLLKDIAPKIPKGSRVIVIPDGPLHRLNLETLPVPSPRPHYWLDDVELAVAPSLAIAASRPENASPRNPAILLIGAPDYRGTDYERLDKAQTEIRDLESRFPGAVQAVYTGPRATPSAYRDAQPARFSIIHFAAHAEASNENPLESAVVLSRQGGSNKLYARDVLSIPIRARLVTVSGCHTAGVRAYAGEGLIGFAWAFLRAGADAVVAGLWDVSDSSTEPLMNEFYGGIASNDDPVAAMHEAKQALIRSQPGFSKPYYWAGFQVYIRSAAR